MVPDLAILIPVYQREEGAIRAVRSIVNQSSQQLKLGSLAIHVRDDASPNIESKRLIETLKSIHPSILADVNSQNLGMSANIRSMVLGCNAVFCSILTDDDWFEAGSISLLLEFIRDLKSDSQNLVTSFFCPRYSYADNGAHVSTSCRLSSKNKIISSSPVTTMELADKGYILTGLFFRPEYVDQAFWSQNESNAFFPVLYFASLLCRGSCVYLDRPLVHHTVFNTCHWDAWGSSTQAQHERLCRDFLIAISLVHRYLLPQCRSMAERIKLWHPAIIAYRNRMIEMRNYVWRSPARCIPGKLWLNPRFLVAFMLFSYFSIRASSHQRSANAL
jgi:hypothetical protein